MASLTSELTVTQLSGKPGRERLWQLKERLVCDLDPEGNETRRIDLQDKQAAGYAVDPAELMGRVIIVPEGFVTDGPSIPRIFWVILPIWGRWSRPGVVHDLLCFLIAIGRPHPEAPTRTHADNIFTQLNGDAGVGLFARTALHVGVRLGTIFGVKTTMVNYNEKLKAAMEAAP